MYSMHNKKEPRRQISPQRCCATSADSYNTTYVSDALVSYRLLTFTYNLKIHYFESWSITTINSQWHKYVDISIKTQPMVECRGGTVGHDLTTVDKNWAPHGSFLLWIEYKNLKILLNLYIKFNTCNKTFY